MLEIPIQVTITLSAPELKDEELQEAVQNLQWEAEEVKGVQASLIAREESPEGAKSLGGFLLDKFKAVLEVKKLPNLVKTLAGRLIAKQTMEFEAVKKDQKGNYKKLKFKISNSEDLAKVMSEVNKFIDG